MSTILPSRLEDAVTIFEQSCAGRRAGRFPQAAKAHLDAIPAALRRSDPPALPEVSEPQLMRHYVRLSQRNVCIDTEMYPLGSCTMKYNPKINETVANLPGFANLHPLQDAVDAQGALELCWNLQHALSELSGLPAVSLQPAAGAHGEFAGLLTMRAWHTERVASGEIAIMPTHVLIPDTAHGTNPASVTMAGFQTLSVRTDERGGMDVDDVRAKVAEHAIVGLMLTNPNTLGLFDERIAEIAAIVHAAGGLLYYDGANFNAIMGRVRPGDMGFDIVHFNTHKTFSTPHGGGGPGAGPIAVSERLAQFVPTPRVIRTDDGSYALDSSHADRSIGQLKRFWGNFGVLVRAWTYIRANGRDGLAQASDLAVLNANYVLARIADAFEPIYGRRCMHEFVISASKLKAEHDVRALDVAKRLIDYGIHPPTVYFPLLVDEALMVEPTETETKESLDLLADALIEIARDAHERPEVVRSAPSSTPLRRLDEARAARQPVLRFGGAPSETSQPRESEQRARREAPSPA